MDMPWQFNPDIRVPTFKGPVYSMITKPAISLTKPYTVPLAIGAGNYITRSYRQKPVVGLTTFTKNTKRVSGNFSKNKILSKSTNKMVYRKKKYSSRRKNNRPKTYRRKRNYGRKRIPMLWPRSKVVRFRLVLESGQLGSGGALTMSPIKANSLNDSTGSLSQQLPLSLDQWSQMYQKYIILGSKITVIPTLTSSTGAVVVGLHLAFDNTSLANHNYYKELPRTRTTMVTTQRDIGRPISLGYSAKKFWHLKNIKDDSEQEGTFSQSPGDPNDLCYFHYFTQDLDASQNSIISSQIIVEYIALLTDPVTPARSSL